MDLHRYVRNFSTTIKGVWPLLLLLPLLPVPPGPITANPLHGGVQISLTPAGRFPPVRHAKPGIARPDTSRSDTTFSWLPGTILARLLDTASTDLPDRSDIERHLGELLDRHETGDDPAAEELILNLQELAANPLNVNRAPAGELMQVPGLTGRLAAAIVAHRRQERPFESVDELTRVSGIGPVTLEQIRPYLSVGSPRELRQDLYLDPSNWVRNGRTELVSRLRGPLDLADGYRTADSLGGYRGGPVNHYQRFHYRSDHLSIGLIRNKRSGERAGGFAAPDDGPVHASISDLGRLRMLVAGDYRMQFGQGLILGGGSVMGKGGDVIRSVNRGGATLRGHTSTQTANAFRGAALSWGGDLELTGFWSRRPRTASTADADSIRLPLSSPAYRTQFEWERRYNTVQRTAGGRLTWRFDRGSVGAGGWHNRFDRPVQRGEGEWQEHDLEGHNASALSADYRLSAGPLQLFGEAGRSGNGGTGLITGLETAAGESTRLTLSWRRYGERFRPLFGDSFSELSGAPQNEQGWYLGLQHRFSGAVRLRGYLDQFTFPGPRFRTRSASHGFDWMGLIDYRPDRRTEIQLRIRRKVRGEEYEAESGSGEPFRLIGPESRFTGRVQLRRQFHPGLRLGFRLERVTARPAAGGRSGGWMVYKDVRVQPRSNLQIDLRLTLFRTDDFDSRIYHFENDLLYSFTSTMLTESGQRFYLLLNYRPVERLQLWLKLAATLFTGREDLGSGRERIPGNRRSDAGFQLRWML